jgi:hypothetical protein
MLVLSNLLSALVHHTYHQILTRKEDIDMTLNNHHNLGHLLGEFGWNKSAARSVLFIWIFLFFPGLLFSFFLVGLPVVILSIYSIYQSCVRLLASKPVLSLFCHSPKNLTISKFCNCCVESDCSVIS